MNSRRWSCRGEVWNAYHLVCQHEHRLQLELSLAVVEEVLEGGAQEVDDHDVVVSLHAEPVHVGDSD